MIERGDWNVSQIARSACDLEGKVVGTIGSGRIGLRVLQRLVPFGCKEFLYFDYTPLPEQVASSMNARRVEKLEDMLSQVCFFHFYLRVTLTSLMRTSAMLSP
jgi:formate dehydrogenase